MLVLSRVSIFVKAIFVLTTFNDHGWRRNRAITSDDVGGVGSILCGFDDAAGKRRVKRQDRIATLKRRHCYRSAGSPLPRLQIGKSSGSSVSRD